MIIKSTRSVSSFSHLKGVAMSTNSSPSQEYRPALVLPDNDSRVVTVLEYLFLFFSVVRCGGIWFSIGGFLDTFANYLTVLIALIPALIAFFLLVQSGCNSFKSLLDSIATIAKPNNPATAAPLLWTTTILASLLLSLISGSNRNAAIFYFFPPICMLILLAVNPSKRFIALFFHRFCNVVVVIAATSLFFWLFGSVLHLIKPTGYVVSDWFEWRHDYQTATYFHLYYEPQPFNFLGIQGIRNCAVFNEAPMFAFPLSVSFAYEALCCSDRDVPRLVVLGASAISTFSITAFIALALCTGYLAIKELVLPRLNKAHVVPTLIASACSVAAISLLLFSSKLGTGSFAVRSDHFVGCLKAFFCNLPFGVGLGNEDVIFNYLSWKQGLSVGLPALLAQCGILSLISFFVPVVAFGRHCYLRRDWNGLAFLLVFIWILTVTIVYNSITCWFILVFLFFESSLPGE